MLRFQVEHRFVGVIGQSTVTCLECGWVIGVGTLWWSVDSLIREHALEAHFETGQLTTLPAGSAVPPAL